MGRSVLAIGFIGVFLVLSGCDLLSSSPQPKPHTDTAENEFVEFSRTVLTPVKAGQSFTVQVKVTAKTELRALLISESLPEGLQVVEGEVRAGRLGLVADETFEHSYTVQANGKPGSLKITGKAITATSEGTQEPLVLESVIQVK